MADGDYTIPTFPGVLPVGGHGGYGHGGGHHRGLEGKDAVHIHSVQDAINDRALAEAVHKNSKEDVIETLESKHESSKQHGRLEVRLERLVCEVGDKLHHVEDKLKCAVRDEGEKTRDLIRDMDEKRRRDARDAAVDAALSAINAKLDSLLP